MNAAAHLVRRLASRWHRDRSPWWLATIAVVDERGRQHDLLAVTISARLWSDPEVASRAMLDRYAAHGDAPPGELVCRIEPTRAPRR